MFFNYIIDLISMYYTDFIQKLIYANIRPKFNINTNLIIKIPTQAS